MENPTKEEILKAIHDSGYLFEQEIASIFERNDFFVYPNHAYIDIDEEKSREIDVMAFKRFYNDKRTKVSISVRIICECKNNTNPFVFVCRNKNSADNRYSPPNFVFPTKEYRKPIKNDPNAYSIITGFQYYNLETVFPYSIIDNKATQFCKIIRKGKDWSAFHDGIYESLLIPMIKCLEFYKESDYDIDQYNDWNNFIVYYPIIVLNSDLFSIDTHIDAGIINKIDSISFTREINSKHYKDKYLVDFVTKDGLQNYIDENIISFMDKFIEIVTQ